MTATSPRSLHIGAAQIHSGGSLEETFQRIERQVRAAAAVGVELLLFAEGALHGYGYGVDMTAAGLRAVAEPVDGPSGRRLVAMAVEHRMTLVVGFFEAHAAGVSNSMLVASPDGRAFAARKHVLTPGELAAELVPGPRQRPVATVNGVRCAIVICADGGIEGLHEMLREDGVDYRLCPTGGGGNLSDTLGEADLRTPEGRARYEANRPRVFKTEAILGEAECPHTGFTSANALGPVGRETCHQGHCMIVDNQRVMRAQTPGTIVREHMQDQLIHATLSF